ncbi:hypothetical protein HDV00_005732 [Rhizophlyctis rosea]|nr:hypothetical protein HDV00_005732 [Rhizophlyctis rosea]
MPVDITFQPLEENNNAYIQGAPGLLSFAVSGRLTITNNTKNGKTVTIKTMAVSFRGTSVSYITFNGGKDGVGNAFAMMTGDAEVSLPRSIDHVNQKGEAIQAGKSLAPGESFEAPFKIIVPGPAKGGPVWLPHSTSIKSPHEIRTYYMIRVEVGVAKKGILGAFSTNEVVANEKIDLKSYDLRFPPVVYALTKNLPSPAPGWIAGEPTNLPPTAESNKAAGPWGDVTFPEGLTFKRYASVPIMVKVTSNIASITAEIKQEINIRNVSSRVDAYSADTPRIADWTDVVFKADVPTVQDGSTFSLSGWVPRAEVISTRLFKKPDIKTPFSVTHTMHITMRSKSGAELHVSTPIIIYDLGQERLRNTPAATIMEAASSMPANEVQHTHQYLNYPLSPCTIQTAATAHGPRPVKASYTPGAEEKGNAALDFLDGIGGSILTDGGQGFSKGPTSGNSSVVGGPVVESLEVFLDHPSDTFYPFSNTHLTGYIQLTLKRTLEGASTITIDLFRKEAHPRIKGGTIEVEVKGSETTVWVHPNGWKTTQYLYAGTHKYPFKLEWKYGSSEELVKYDLRVKVHRKPTKAPEVTKRKLFMVASGHGAVTTVGAPKTAVGAGEPLPVYREE